MFLVIFFFLFYWEYLLLVDVYFYMFFAVSHVSPFLLVFIFMPSLAFLNGPLLPMCEEGSLEL